MGKNSFFFLAFLFTTISLQSCKSEDAVIAESIVGVWDVYASKINKKDNDFVRNGWFEFTTENMVNSNVFPDDRTKKFFIENKRLKIEMEPTFDLKISELNNDTMHLEGKLSYYYMEYFMVKRKE